ncbi:uncharacterized protein LTR77_008437 [Saxophila tyrrhenica]|uniref:Protein kinase domain-containing protein n=1 Tax=Saxophila tyrrhenica TaxID=1690608 RepID=A0AAV9P1C2_9PEZI|nr:hypothetical protein LTR77_008437 [Saxophila tyrrhenica]
MASRHQRIVAYLRLRHRDFDRVMSFTVSANDDYHIGREEVEDSFNIKAQSISKHHVKIRCGMYDELHEDTRVAPMVYARVLSKNPVRLVRQGMDGEDRSHRVSSMDSDVLLDDGDVLELSDAVSVEFVAREEYAATADGLNDTQWREFELLRPHYEVTNRRLGVGGNASVFVAVKAQSLRQVACKVLPVPFVNPEAEARIMKDLKLDDDERDARLADLERRMNKRRSELTREYGTLKDLNHPNIVALEKVIYTPNNIYIFQELITGGDLMSYTDLKGVLGEPQAAVIVRQILKAVEYLHDNGIVHRDIKPENVLMTSWRDGARVVLTDFGQARTVGDAKAVAKKSAVFRMQSVVGTIGYTAPEVLRQLKRDLHDKGYSKAIDIWSVGCIAAVLLTGEMLCLDQPNAMDEDLDYSQLSQAIDLDVLDTATWWQSVGRKPKSFVRGCAAVDETQRLTAKQALLHEWFTNRHYADELEAAYQRAIADWKPRQGSGNVIEYIDTDVKTTKKRTTAASTKSHHFAVPAQQPAKPSLFFGTKNNVPTKAATTAFQANRNDSSDEEMTQIPESPPQHTTYETQVTVDPEFTEPSGINKDPQMSFGQPSIPSPPPFSLPGWSDLPPSSQMPLGSLPPPPPDSFK